MILQVINLGRTEVTCARFRRTGNGPQPVSGLRRNWHSHDELRAILQEQCPPLPEETRTILALPPELLSLRELQLPFSDRRKVREVLPLELAGTTAAGGSDIVCDAIPLQRDGLLLAGWAEREAIAELIELLKQANMEPEAVTLGCLHWHRLLPPADGGQETVLYDDTALVVATPQGPLFCRTFEQGGDPSVTEQSMTAAELILGRTISRRYQIEPDATSLSDSSKPLPLPPQLAQLGSSGDLPATALASALATAMAFSDSGCFNLRHGPLAWRGQTERLLRSFRLPLILASVLLLLLFGRLGLRWYQLTADLQERNAAIATLYKQAFPTRTKPVDESAEFRAEIQRLEGGSRSSGTLQFMQQLAAAQGNGITALSELEFDGSQFLLKGTGRSSADVSGFSRRIATNGWQVTAPELTARPDGSVLFSLRGNREGGKP